jgi:hypothetical protein
MRAAPGRGASTRPSADVDESGAPLRDGLRGHPLPARDELVADAIGAGQNDACSQRDLHHFLGHQHSPDLPQGKQGTRRCPLSGPSLVQMAGTPVLRRHHLELRTLRRADRHRPGAAQRARRFR